MPSLSARFLHLAMAAAREAYVDAGLDQKEGSIDPHRVAVVVGSAFGGLDLLDAEQERMSHRRSLAASPYLVPGMIINQAAGQIAQQLRLYGPSAAPANACASGGHAVVLGAMFLRSGDADLAVCGAGESAFTPAVINGFATMKALLGRKAGDRSEDDPGQASRPFSRDRGGFVLAEGAGALVLATETAIGGWGWSRRRSSLGWATNSDGHHMAMPCRERIATCLATAIGRAGVKPDAIDYYNAHGTSTVVNDRVETQVLKDVWGEHGRSGCRSARSRGRLGTVWGRRRRWKRRWRCGPSGADHPAHHQFPAGRRAGPGLCAQRGQAGSAGECAERLVRIRRHEQRLDSEEAGVMIATTERDRLIDQVTAIVRKAAKDPGEGRDQAANHGWSKTLRSIRSIWSVWSFSFRTNLTLS